MKRTDEDVLARLSGVTPAARRRDGEILVQLFRETTGLEPAVWSGGIIGFGHCHYRYPTGTEGDSPVVAFAPRKVATTVYLLDGVGAHADALGRLGPHTTGSGCVYLKSLDEVDTEVLRDILSASSAWVASGGSPGMTITALD